MERYWSILDGLSLEALRASDKEASRDDERAIRRYFLLCEDELEMGGNGYISDSTYLEWADGIIQQLNQPMFAETWSKVSAELPAGEPEQVPYTNLRRLFQERDPRMADPATHYHRIKLSGPARAIRGLKGIAGV